MQFEEVIIELSYNCNLSCSMCGFGKHVNPHSKDKFMSFENYKQLITAIGPISKSVRLNGRGESTIHPQFVDILEYSKSNYPNLGINLFSNFSFKNQKILNALIQHQVQLFISMDSPIADELETIRKGAKFHFIENNLKALKELPNRPFIIFTIQESNLHRIKDMAQFAFNHNCHILYNTIRRDQGIELFVSMVKDAKENIQKQFDEVQALYSDSNLQCLLPDQLAGIQILSQKATVTHGSMQSCPILEKELCIFYEGTTTPCNMFNPYVYGNMFEESLEEIWNGERRKNFLETHKNHYYCNNCANLGK